jgi:hypothetical protein
MKTGNLSNPTRHAASAPRWAEKYKFQEYVKNEEQSRNVLSNQAAYSLKATSHVSRTSGHHRPNGEVQTQLSLAEEVEIYSKGAFSTDRSQEQAQNQQVEQKTKPTSRPSKPIQTHTEASKSLKSSRPQGNISMLGVSSQGTK